MGIIVVEFEHDNPDQEVIFPKWIIKAIEVTDSLSSHHLARIATELRNTGGKINPNNYESLIRNRVPKIVLTGGPCSGKSKLLEIIKQQMESRVRCVPEVATMLMEQLEIQPFSNHYRFTLDQYRIQKILEATSESQAANEGKSAVILDRGNPDGAAYTKRGWKDFCAICHTEKEEELNRYQMVICLDVPEKDIYEMHKKNNPARRETWEEALALEKKTKAVWSEHPNFYSVENCGSWEEKEAKVLQIIKQFLG